ncbi:MAG: hypothetical protein KAI55_04805 [Candidatus Aenigmarchaeota archaeon]|nr:hypothetical protein [Candidatus Aenigmarchaeota archaeon]
MNRKGYIKLMIGLMIGVCVVALSTGILLFNSQKNLENTIGDIQGQTESVSNICRMECINEYNDNNGNVEGVTCPSNNIPCEDVLWSKEFQ